MHTLDKANNHLLYTNALFRKAKEIIDKLIKEKVEAEKTLRKTILKIQKREVKNCKKSKRGSIKKRQK